MQEIKQRELEEWKKRTQCELQQECGRCLSNFGAAHIAACETSCEEGEALQQKREEYDLMAASRGRTAMLSEQRKRDREAEERLAKKKKRQQRNAGVQADIVSKRDFGTNVEQFEDDEEQSEEESVRVEKPFVSKPNLHKSSASSYNPKNFTSHSIDSSNNLDSEVEESSPEVEESEEEFNQITNLLRNKFVDIRHEPRAETVQEPIEVSESSEDEPVVPPPPKKHVKLLSPKKKSILKKAQSPKGAKSKSKPKPKQPEPRDNRVQYLDFGNKFVTSYIPGEDLVTENVKSSKPNASKEAKRQEKKVVSDDVLR